LPKEEFELFSSYGVKFPDEVKDLYAKKKKNEKAD
jgi:hypothetical protein